MISFIYQVWNTVKHSYNEYSIVTNSDKTSTRL